MTYITENGNA